MNEPDLYFPLYGDDFFADVEGWPDFAIVGYQRALWHYWKYTHCEGLRDMDSLLKSITRAKEADWQDMKELVFDNKSTFKKIAGLWHQKRALSEWNKAVQIMKARSLRGRDAANSRWK
jgi:hypothetical protein